MLIKTNTMARQFTKAPLAFHSLEAAFIRDVSGKIL